MNNTVTIDVKKYTDLVVERVNFGNEIKNHKSKITNLKEEIFNLKEVIYIAFKNQYSYHLVSVAGDKDDYSYKELLNNKFNLTRSEIDEIIIRYQKEKEEEEK